MDLQRFDKPKEFTAKEMPNAEFIRRLKERIAQKDLLVENGQYTLDRYEGEYAVLEDRVNKNMLDIKKEEMPPNAKEGDILEYKGGVFQKNEEVTEQARDEVAELMRQLRKK